MSEYKFDDTVSFSEISDLPSHVELEESVCTVFVSEDGEVSDPLDLDELLGLKQSEQVAEDASSVRKDLREKAFEHSTQSKKEIHGDHVTTETLIGKVAAQYQEPEYLVTKCNTTRRSQSDLQPVTLDQVPQVVLFEVACIVKTWWSLRNVHLSD